MIEVDGHHGKKQGSKVWIGKEAKELPSSGGVSSKTTVSDPLERFMGVQRTAENIPSPPFVPMDVDEDVGIEAFERWEMLANLAEVVLRSWNVWCQNIFEENSV